PPKEEERGFQMFQVLQQSRHYVHSSSLVAADGDHREFCVQTYAAFTLAYQSRGEGRGAFAFASGAVLGHESKDLATNASLVFTFALSLHSSCKLKQLNSPRECKQEAHYHRSREPRAEILDEARGDARGESTQSLLQWTPLKTHNGQTLTCRAEHPKFNHSSIESKLPLNIYYVPVATMHLGAKINPNDIEEGDDVYFGCDVDANPPAYKVVWEHDHWTRDVASPMLKNGPRLYTIAESESKLETNVKQEPSRSDELSWGRQVLEWRPRTGPPRFPRWMQVASCRSVHCGVLRGRPFVQILRSSTLWHAKLKLPLADWPIWQLALSPDTILQHNAASGVILTGNTNLALRNVSRHQAGKYTCTASNVEGDGRSPPLHMQVVYRPLCRKKEIKMIGAALQEPSSVVCEVDAFPPPATFEWKLNNSAGFIKVDPERYTVQSKEGKSVLTYTPVSDVDYGTLFCRASNLAGQQVMPCVYTLLPATRPEAPYNCTVYNLTDDSLDLVCSAVLIHFDMDMDSGSEWELRAKPSHSERRPVLRSEGLVVNSTNGVAVWNLRRLGAKRQLRLNVYSANARGRSEHVTFTVETAPRLSPRTEAQEAWEVNWALGGVLGAAVTVAIVLCLALVATRLRQRARDYEVENVDENVGSCVPVSVSSGSARVAAAAESRCSEDEGLRISPEHVELNSI
ncbi:hypothetical protein MSG28_001796, partial [Choristoneura fumiferana]